VLGEGGAPNRMAVRRTGGGASGTTVVGTAGFGWARVRAAVSRAISSECAERLAIWALAVCAWMIRRACCVRWLRRRHFLDAVYSAGGEGSLGARVDSRRRDSYRRLGAVFERERRRSFAGNDRADVGRMEAARVWGAAGGEGGAEQVDCIEPMLIWPPLLLITKVGCGPRVGGWICRRCEVVLGRWTRDLRPKRRSGVPSGSTGGPAKLCAEAIEGRAPLRNRGDGLDGRVLESMSV
jgi:hypothetical protein